MVLNKIMVLSKHFQLSYNFSPSISIITIILFFFCSCSQHTFNILSNNQSSSIMIKYFFKLYVENLYLCSFLNMISLFLLSYVIITHIYISSYYHSNSKLLSTVYIVIIVCFSHVVFYYCRLS